MIKFIKRFQNQLASVNTIAANPMKPPVLSKFEHTRRTRLVSAAAEWSESVFDEIVFTEASVLKTEIVFTEVSVLKI